MAKEPRIRARGLARRVARRVVRVPNHVLSGLAELLPARRRSGPLVSVIIATYNRPKNLRIAIRSALEQTYRDLEVLVVGDGCTDDTEQVVRSIADERVRWLELETNSGSQSLPNNVGLAAARGTYVAYLGHDDVWLPGHVAALVGAMERDSLDAATTRSFWIGPPGSDALTVSGAGLFSNRSVAGPPSALCHRLDIVERTGGWIDYRELPADRAPDDEFIARVNAASAGRRALRRVGVIKLPAAWRRDFYRSDEASEQAEWFRRSRAPRRLVVGLLMGAITTDLRGRRITLPTDDLEPRPGEHVVDAWRRLKGLPERGGAPPTPSS